MTKDGKQKKTFQQPHVFTILVILILVIAVLSFFAPTGEYGTYVNDAGESVIDVNSFHAVDRSPVDLEYMITLIPRGFIANITLIAYVLFCLGSFKIVGKTKAVDAMVNSFLKKLHGRDSVIIIILSTLFTACGSAFGWSIEAAAFIPMGIMIAGRMGYDKYMGTAMIMMPTMIGWGTGLIYSGSTLVVQDMIGVPPLSGLGYRAVCLVVLYLICTVLLCLEGKRQRKANKDANVTAATQTTDDADLEFTTRRKLIVAWFVFAIAFMVITTTVMGWSLTHVAGIYLFMGIGTAILDGQGVNQICRSVTDGVADYTVIALVLALAQSVVLILEDTFLMDPFIHMLATMLQTVPLPLVGVFAFLVVVLLTFFIGGFPGKAVILSPILGSLSVLLGFNPQVIVLALVFGDGIAKWFWPASSNCAIVVAAGNLEYLDWAKFILTRFLVVIGIMMAILIGILQAFNITW